MKVEGMVPHRHNGQAVVELAIALLFLMVFALGTVDFGRIFYANIALVNAAREGVQVAVSLPADDPSYAATVKSAVTSVAIDPFSGPIDSAKVDPGSAYDDHRTVSVDYSFKLVLPFLGGLIDKSASNVVPLYATATLPVANRPVNS